MYVDFRQLKQRVGIEQVLAHYNVNLRKVDSNYLKGSCPLRSHSSRNSTVSFIVNLPKNVWSCKSDSCIRASGRKGGNILDLVALMDNCDFKAAAEKIASWFPDGMVAEKKELSPKAEGNTLAVGVGKSGYMEKLIAELPNAVVVRPKSEGNTEPPAASGNTLVNPPLAFKLTGIVYHHWLKEKKGITEETARKFGVGLFTGRGSMAGRIVIPIHNEKGELIAYAGRAVNGEKPKYRLPNGFHKSKVLYNLHRIGEQQEVVIVVEGFFDCILLAQEGVPCVALIGTSVSDEQAQILKRFKRVIFCLDSDEAGRMASVKLVKL
jgi:DNA primase